MSELAPLKITNISLDSGFRAHLPRREEFDQQIGAMLPVIDDRGAVALARDEEYQKRLLNLPKLDADGPWDEFFEAMSRLKEFGEWLDTYPLAQGLTPTEKAAAQYEVLNAADKAARSAPQAT